MTAMLAGARTRGKLETSCLCSHGLEHHDRIAMQTLAAIQCQRMWSCTGSLSPISLRVRYGLWYGL